MSVAVPLGSRLARSLAIPSVSIYGKRWDLNASLLRLTLAVAGVANRFVDIEAHPEAARILTDVGGADPDKLPVVDVDGEWLSRPDPKSLTDALRRHGLV